VDCFDPADTAAAVSITNCIDAKLTERIQVERFLVVEAFIMLRWLTRRLTRDRYQGHTAAEWCGYFRYPQYFRRDLAGAVTEALRKEVATKGESLDIEAAPFLSVLLATDDREGVRCLAAIKMGLDKRTGCESTLLAALNDESETVRRAVALSLVALNTVHGLAAVVAGSRHGHAVRSHAAHLLREHGAEASEAIPGLLALLRDRNIDWRSHFDAVDALVAIGESAIPWLLQLFGRGNRRLRYYAAIALKEIDKTPELLAAIDEELAKHKS
jgi:HEAT repeat protein